MRVASKWVIGGRSRRGAAAVELAILLPVLTLLFVGVLDFGRVFYHYQIVTECARNGARYASGSTANSTNTAAIQSAARAGATNLSPQPTVTFGPDPNGNPYVYVNVSYDLKMITNYIFSSGKVTVSRKVWMRVAQ
jgi:Flp pilus assembly protein TadG